MKDKLPLIIIAIGAIVLTGCSKQSRNTTKERSETVDAVSAVPGSLKSEVTTNPKDRVPTEEAATKANEQIMPAFQAFFAYLNQSLENSHRLDLATTQSVLNSSYTLDKAVSDKMSPDVQALLLQSITKEYGNEPGMFTVLDGNGVKGEFQFRDEDEDHRRDKDLAAGINMPRRMYELKDGDVIEERGNGKQRWRIFSFSHPIQVFCG